MSRPRGQRATTPRAAGHRRQKRINKSGIEQTVAAFDVKLNSREPLLSAPMRLPAGCSKANVPVPSAPLQSGAFPFAWRLSAPLPIGCAEHRDSTERAASERPCSSSRSERLYQASANVGSARVAASSAALALILRPVARNRFARLNGGAASVGSQFIKIRYRRSAPAVASVLRQWRPFK